MSHVKYHLKINLHSDTAFSAPATQGVTLDSEIALDEFGLPTVSGKTLHGLLRDTWLTIAPVFDQNEIVGRRLLGTHGTARPDGILHIGNAKLCDKKGAPLEPWAKWLHEDRRTKANQNNPLPADALREAFLSVRARTAVDRKTDAPLPETLRFARVLPAHSVFVAQLIASRPLETEELELLERLYCLTRHAGSDRNRGMGAIEIKLLKEETSPNDTTNGSVTLESAQDVVFLHYQLTLTAPCMVGTQNTDPNSRSGKSFVPGANVRGAVARAMLDAKRPDAEIAALVASPDVRFLNAYKQEANRRSLPTPVGFRRIKNPLYEDNDDDAQCRNDADMLLLPEARLDNDEEGQREPIKSAFLVPANQEYTVAEPHRTANIHQRRNRDTGATTEDKADDDTETVFQYEALAAGQSFRGVVVLHGEAVAKADDLIRLLTGSSLWLGRSARSGYGGVPVVEVFVKQSPTTRTYLDREGDLPRDVSEGTLFDVRLTADAVLRDPLTGQHDPHCLQDALVERFGASSARIEGTLVQTGTAHGYNALWRTHLPAVPCAKAGSIVRFTATQEISRDELVRLCAEPIGERISEGMGAFVVAVAETDIKIKKDDTSSPPEQPIGPTPEEWKNAQKRLYLRRLRILAGAEAHRIACAAKAIPSRSLLQRLRTPLRSDEWRSTYADWFGQDTTKRLRDVSRKALQECDLLEGDRPTALDTYLKRYASPEEQEPVPLGDDANRVQRRYALHSDALTEWKSAREEDSLRLYFLDALLSQMARRKQAEEGK